MILKAKNEKKVTYTEKEVELVEFAFVAAENNLSEIFGRIQGGTHEGKWVTLVSTSAGAIFERIQPGKRFRN